MTELEFIKRFSKITIRKACEDTGVSPSNLWSGKANSIKVQKVREYIVTAVNNLLLEYGQSEDNSL